MKWVAIAALIGAFGIVAWGAASAIGRMASRQAAKTARELDEILDSEEDTGDKDE